MIREEFEKEYQKRLEEIVLPDTLRENFTCIDCLKERKDICTLLLCDRTTDQKYVLKIAQDSRKRMLEYEEHILQELFESGNHAFPRPQLLLKEGASTYFLREYAEGETLLTIVKKRGCMPEKVLIRTAIQLCDLLELLHSQKPPVIHRDIKPENIIFTKSKKFTLIDFETARRYSSGKKRDTLIIGSRPTAAPEQFGYAQTDGRTDIYGLGMTLLFLACGTYERKDLRNVCISRKLRKVILKTIAFDPAKRYKNVALLRKELVKCSILCRKTDITNKGWKNKVKCVKEESHERQENTGIDDGIHAGSGRHR